MLISDTHGMYEELGILSGDVLIHCGDFCHGYHNDGTQIKAIDRWFSKQQFQRILCVGGNHDFLAQTRYAKGEKVFENAVYLQDIKHEFNGITLYGSPWLPDLEGWASYLPDSERQRKWKLIPHDTSILITHTPPF